MNKTCPHCNEVLINDLDVQVGQHVDRSRCFDNFKHYEDLKKNSVESLGDIFDLSPQEWEKYRNPPDSNGFKSNSWWVRCGRITVRIAYEDYQGWVSEIRGAGTRGPSCTNIHTSLWSGYGFKSFEQALFMVKDIINYGLRITEAMLTGKLTREAVIDETEMREYGRDKFDHKKYSREHAVEFVNWCEILFGGKTTSEVLGVRRVLACKTCGYYYLEGRHDHLEEGSPCPSAHDCGETLVATHVTTEDLEVQSVSV